MSDWIINRMDELSYLPPEYNRSLFLSKRLMRKHVQVFQDFCDKLISNQKPCPPEFLEMVDKHFWELV